MTPEFPEPFALHYDCLLKRLKLHGLQPETIALFSNGIRRAGAYFAYRIDALTREQLTDYFVHVVDQLSWSTLKHNLYGLKSTTRNLPPVAGATKLSQKPAKKTKATI